MPDKEMFFCDHCGMVHLSEEVVDTLTTFQCWQLVAMLEPTIKPPPYYWKEIYPGIMKN